MTKRLVWLLAIAAVLCLFGCDATNATSGYGGGAIGNTPPNPIRPDGANAYGTTGGAQVQGSGVSPSGSQ